MKKISKIELENSRAYYDRMTFSLSQGENLLLYGENGSGKTSLYKSLNDFIQSFYTHVIYTNNRYKPSEAFGEVKLSIGDFDETTHQFSNVMDYSFGKGADNTAVENTGFMKALALSKGFLNYRDLLKVYLTDEDNPNLFNVIVLSLLKNHVPIAQGLSTSIQIEWKELNDDIFKVYNRNENKHRRGLSRLKKFEEVIRAVLDSLFEDVNKYLGDYFDYFGLKVEYALVPMKFEYNDCKCHWYIPQDLRLGIKLDNATVASYTEGLNEARLSAIAICLYLAALRANPGDKLRLMFLDDIFIGIDSVNRRPILKILDREFKDFQIIIATYDRAWYFMAKKYLEKGHKAGWKFANLFSLPMSVGEVNFTVPIMSEGLSNYDVAKEYLHGKRDIDLPAVANYFRKALEERISTEYLPKELFFSDDYSIVPGFKLTNHVDSLSNLFSLIGEDLQYINTIDTFLHPLIHPLSHFDEESQVYRSELIQVEKAIAGLSIQIDNLSKKCVLLLGKGNKVAIHYDTVDGTYKSTYHILLEDNIWLYKDATGVGKISSGKCRTCYMEGCLDGSILKPCGIGPDAIKFSYASLDEGLKKIYDYEVNHNHHNVIAHHEYDIVEIIVGKVERECLHVRIERLLAGM